MSTAIAPPVQTLTLFSASIDRRHASVPMYSEVSSREATDTVDSAREAKERSRTSFLTALLRSLAAFAA